jgi:predicted transposase YbfD/YdcC
MATDASILRCFADVPDPRIDRTKLHALSDILFITLCAVIVGAESWETVATFGKSKRDWLKRFVPLANGIPSPDTFERVFARLDPKAFPTCVVAWLTAVCEATGLKHVAIDGKAVRGAKQSTFSGCLHLVNAWAVENRLILGQEAVADKSNEITAIPKLLEVLDLKGALVTIDAAGCQKEIAQQIRNQGGDYLLAVKGNQPTLEAAVQQTFEAVLANDFAGVAVDHHATIEDGHGRHEERYVTVISDPQGLPPEWPDVAAVVLVGSEREVKGVNASSARYYITSRRGTAQELGQYIRRHWAVENELHWCLDVSFREDASRVASGHAGTNLGLVRRVALSLVKQAPGKGYGPAKRLKAALDEKFLEQVLQGNAGN